MDACLTAWADGANQLVMLPFQPGATVLIRLSASEVARCALQGTSPQLPMTDSDTDENTDDDMLM